MMSLRAWWMCVLVLSIVMLSLSSTSVLAQDTAAVDPHEVQPERPSVATHAGTVAPRWIELETGVERDRFDATTISYTVPTEIKIGLASHLQFDIFVPLVKPAGNVGASCGDLAIALKYRLTDDAPVLGDFALLPILKLPTGAASRGAGTGTTDESIILISSHDFSGISMDINAGITHRSGDGSLAPMLSTLWTVSFAGDIFSQLGWGIECYGYPGTRGSAGQRPIIAFLFGPTLRAWRYLVFDAGVIIPAKGPQPQALYAGFVYNLGRV